MTAATTSWQQLSFSTDDSLAENISSWLLDNGAVSVTLSDAKDNPILEPKPASTPLWLETKITALFTHAFMLEPLLITLKSEFGSHINNLELESLSEKNWQQQWQQSLKPTCFGEKLWIYPRHLPINPDHQFSMQLDPGLAFGTGTHPSTALCLNWLATRTLHHKTLIDYGCGSGILSIAAAKLGAEKIWAVDYDPQAITATQENAQQNHICPNQLSVSLSDNCQLSSVDIVIANILVNTIIELKPILTQCTKPSGLLVLAGILAEQIPMIKSAFAAAFEFAKPWYQEEGLEKWVLLCGRKFIGENLG